MIPFKCCLNDRFVFLSWLDSALGCSGAHLMVQRMGRMESQRGRRPFADQKDSIFIGYMVRAR